MPHHMRVYSSNNVPPNKDNESTISPSKAGGENLSAR